MKKSLKKLQVSRETVRQLEAGELAQAAGGRILLPTKGYDCSAPCPSQYQTCVLCGPSVQC